MAKYFTMAEMCDSTTAKKNNIKNEPSESQKRNLQYLMDNVLDKVRELWKAPITVSSGFRCPELNKLVKGSPTSQHMRGEAADISAGSPALNKRLFDYITRNNIPYDQCIDEYGYRWIHISCKFDQVGNRHKAFHLG
jgi:zinc D-Ala-D-Ala carboxypeptidase